MNNHYNESSDDTNIKDLLETTWTYGKHRGEPLLKLVMERSGYIDQYRNNPKVANRNRVVLHKIGKLVELFDSAPIIGTCAHLGCENKPTGILVHGCDVVNATPVCDKCLKESQYDYPVLRVSLNTYEVAMDYTRFLAMRGRMVNKLIHRMAILKGYPERLGSVSLVGILGHGRSLNRATGEDRFLFTDGDWDGENYLNRPWEPNHRLFPVGNESQN